jgi:hypothetical protein
METAPKHTSLFVFVIVIICGGEAQVVKQVALGQAEKET